MSINAFECAHNQAKEHEKFIEIQANGKGPHQQRPFEKSLFNFITGMRALDLSSYNRFARSMLPNERKKKEIAQR